MHKKLPIGIDDFSKLRRNDLYFVDKSLMIRDFLETGDKAALIKRPGYFGKTLNLSMLREFLDITKNNQDLFEGLAIMDTEYVECMNSRPVLYFSFQNCQAQTAAELVEMIRKEICREYVRYEYAVQALAEEDSYEAGILMEMSEAILVPGAALIKVESAISFLLHIVKKYYGYRIVLLIDGCDQPVMSSYTYGYDHELKEFFTNLYSIAVRENDMIDQVLLTAKECALSPFYDLKVYAGTDDPYAFHFGFTLDETCALWDAFGLEWDETVRKKYACHLVDGAEIYCPWMVLNDVERRSGNPGIFSSE